MSTTATPGYNDVTTYQGPTPGAGSYGVLQAQAENAYSSALNQINSQRTSFLQQQGLTGQYDATSGNFTGFGVDAHNQSGAFQQMENANAGQGAADSAAIGAMGFGGGLAAQQHEAADKGYSQNATNWALGVGSQLGNLGQQDIAATQKTGDQLYNGLVDNITTAIGNGTFDPAQYTNISIPGYGTLTSDQINTVAQGLGYGTTPAGGGTTGSGPLGGGTSAGTGHPHYDAYTAAGGKMTYNQWIASGKPGHRG